MSEEDMAYKPRIPVATQYAQKLGQATYNFTYLEWAVIWSIEKLSPGFLNEHAALTAGQIGSRFISAVGGHADLEQSLRGSLLRVARDFKVLTNRRNDLLHAHPYTAEGGEQRLNRKSRTGNVDWTEDEIDQLAEAFERCAIEVNDIFHGHLIKR